MKIINLKNNMVYLKDYIYLRNTYSDCLLTKKVTKNKTKQWLKTHQVDIFIAILKEEVVGAIIIYYEKNNEITIFTKYKNKGIGSKLLFYILNKAKFNKYDLWAWIEQNNVLSYKLFKKFGFIKIKDFEKEFKGMNFNGYILKKFFKSD